MIRVTAQLMGWEKVLSRLKIEGLLMGIFSTITLSEGDRREIARSASKKFLIANAKKRKIVFAKRERCAILELRLLLLYHLWIRFKGLRVSNLRPFFICD